MSVPSNVFLFIPKMSSPVLKKVKIGSGSNKSGTALFWFRSDLRLGDNTALSHCLSVSATSSTPVLALFLLSRDEWDKHDMASIKVDFILRSLQSLRKDLKERLGVPLIVLPVETLSDSAVKAASFMTPSSSSHYSSISSSSSSYSSSSSSSSSYAATAKPIIQNVAQTVVSLCKKWNVTSLFANKEYEVDELKRDQIVHDLLAKDGIMATFMDDQCIVEPGKVNTKEGKPYSVFTPFKNNWLNVIANDSKRYMTAKEVNPQPWPEQILSAVAPLGKIPETINGFVLPDNIAEIRSLWPAGESVALERLEKFCVTSRINSYHDSRNTPSNVLGTSRLSPYLSVGSLSARECLRQARKTSKVASKGMDTWISELCWRDFYRHVLFHFPRVGKNRPFKEDFSKVKWRVDEKGFEAWKAGKTGFPIVDAAMRELLSTGYMHNRCRMITAMFLTKDLLIDWRKGEEYFMRHLIDGDFASNNGGWQWSASTGTDAQPYFRVFNPLLQSEKVDPDGSYIRRHLPELSDLNDSKRIHQPNLQDCAKYSYPKPIVNHDEARKRAIAAFKQIKEQ